ncbi:MAG: hypothetical protein NW207_12230 [Cytophagales bacterium]|nr:hypothetical protein [Cytophagales bacterium]
MKKFLFYTIIILSAACTSLPYKVLETAGKKPDWLNGAEENYIITNGQGADAETAKQECLRNIRDQIISAVAINVRSKTEININQKNGVTDEQFKTSIVSQSADIPSLQGISLTNAKDSYWEKVLYKSDNSIKFGFHVKYPFPKSELARLLDEYNKADEAVTAFIAQAEKSLDTLSNLDRVEYTLAQLTAYEKRLIDNRKEKCQLLTGELQSRIKNIKAEVKDISETDAVIYLKIGKNILKTNKNINFKSNCAKNIIPAIQGNTYVLKWEGSLCKYTDAPTLSYDINITGKNISFTSPLDFSKNKVNFSIQGDVRFTTTSKSDNTIKSAEVELVINPSFDTPFRIYKAEFNFKNTIPIAAVLDEKIAAKSVKNIKSSLPNISLIIDKTSSAKQAFPYIDGAIYYENTMTGKKDIYKFQNQKYVTDW